VKERRRQATHPAAVKPELIAERPNAVWSWDITRLGGAAKWNWFYLYVIIDIFSRYVPGWMLAAVENHTNARALLADTIAKQNITPGQLYIHSDRGSPMIAKPVAFMLAELGVTKSHSRPHVSNDNRSAKPSSARSSIGPGSPTGSGPSPTPASTARRSSPGTTSSTATPASGSTPRSMSTTDKPPRSALSVKSCSTPPTPPKASGRRRFGRSVELSRSLR
jgi:hypothetical protein